MKPTPTSNRSSHQRFWGIIFILISAAGFGAMPIFANYAYKYGVGPVHSSILSTFEPVVTIYLSWIFFGEGQTLIKFFGGVMILTAGIMLAGNLQGLQQKRNSMPKKQRK